MTSNALAHAVSLEVAITVRIEPSTGPAQGVQTSPSVVPSTKPPSTLVSVAALPLKPPSRAASRSNGAGQAVALTERERFHKSFTRRRCNFAGNAPSANNLTARQWCVPFERMAGRLGGFAGGNFAADRSVLGGFVLGTTLGLVWTPCAGPVLGSILTVIATSKDTAWASALLVTYAIGAAIPMLAIAYGGQAVTTRVRSLSRIAPRLQQGFGVVVIGFAALSWFQYDTLIVAWLTHFYPNGQIGL